MMEVRVTPRNAPQEVRAGFPSPELSPINPRGFAPATGPTHFVFQKIDCELPFSPEQEGHHSAEEDDRHGIAASSFDDALDWFLSDKGSADAFEKHRQRATMMPGKGHRRTYSHDVSPSLRKTTYSSKASPLSLTEPPRPLNIARLTRPQRAQLSQKLGQFEQRLQASLQRLREWDLAKIGDLYSDTDSTISGNSVDLDALAATVDEEAVERKIAAKMEEMLASGEFQFEEPAADLDSSLIISQPDTQPDTHSESSQLMNLEEAKEEQPLRLSNREHGGGVSPIPVAAENNTTTYSAFVDGLQEQRTLEFPTQRSELLEAQALEHMVGGGDSQDQIKDFLTSFVLHDSPVRFSKVAKPIEAPRKLTVEQLEPIERSSTAESAVGEELQTSFAAGGTAQEWQGFMQQSRLRGQGERASIADFTRQVSAPPEALLAKQNFFMPSSEDQLRAMMSADFASQIFIQRQLTGMRRAVNIFSDYELAHYRNISQQILDKDPKNQTANIILGQIDYCAMHYEGALAYFSTALEANTVIIKKWFSKKKKKVAGEGSSAEGFLWSALTLFELYQDAPARKKKRHLLECENALIQAYKQQKRNLTTLWLLFQLSLMNETAPRDLRHKMKFKAADYYHKIYSLDTYLGAICWADLQYTIEKQPEKAVKALLELVHKHRRRVPAMLRLWYYFHRSPDSSRHQKALDIAESLFFSTQKDPTLTALRNISTLMYAKSLIKTGDNEVCFRLLQSKFAQMPHLPMLLLYFAKWVAKSQDRVGYGAAIGALQECLRSCIPERLPQVHYWLGRIYESSGQVYHMMTHYSKAKVHSHLLSAKKQLKIRQVTEKHATIIKLQVSVQDSRYNELNREIKFKDKLSSAQLEGILTQLAGYCEFSASYYDAQINLMLYGKHRIEIISDNAQKAEKLLIELDDVSPEDVTAGLEYLKVLKKTANWQQIDCFAFKLLKKTQNSVAIPTDQWAQCVLWRAKSLFQRGRVKKALGVLKRLYSAFPQVPITSTQNFAPDDPFASPGGDQVDSDGDEPDGALLSMSVLEKIAPNLPRNETLSSNKSEEVDRLSQPSAYLKRILSNESEELQGFSLQDLVDQKGEFKKREKSPELVRKSQLLDKLSIKIRDVRNSRLEVPDYAKFTVYSDPSFLYYIGKFCAKSGSFLKEARQALQDYLLLLNSAFSPARVAPDTAAREAKAKFWFAIVLFKLKQREDSIKALKEAKTALFTVQLRQKYQVAEKMLSLLRS